MIKLFENPKIEKDRQINSRQVKTSPEQKKLSLIGQEFDCLKTNTMGCQLFNQNVSVLVF